jgi:hypothetical protein
VTDSTDALRAALEAAGLSLSAIPEEQRAMFTSLTEEEVTRLITLRTGRPARDAAEPTEAAQPTEAAASTDPDASGSTGLNTSVLTDSETPASYGRTNRGTEPA